MTSQSLKADDGAASRRSLVLIWLTAAGLAGVLAALIYPLDLSLSRFISDTSFWPGDIRRIFKFSECFAHGSGILFILFAVWALAPMARKHIPRIIACALGAGLMANLIKMCVARRRPMVLDESVADVDLTWAANLDASRMSAENLMDYGWQSFPSGHAATATGLAIGLAWTFPQGRWLFAALAVLASVQRIQCQAHWPSDVLAGACVGILAGGLFTVFAAPGQHRLLAGNQADNPASADSSNSGPDNPRQAA